MKGDGVTLIELAVVISIISILIIALGFSFEGWIGKYRVEKTVKELYADLMSARMMAMQRNRVYFADFNLPAANAPCYRIISDTAAVNDWDTEGDGLWDADNDNVLDAVHTVLPAFPKAIEYSITWTGGTIIFDKRGNVQPSSTPLGGTICLTTTSDPDYDCIKISTTRINLGKLKTQISDGGACKGDNCDAK